MDINICEDKKIEMNWDISKTLECLGEGITESPNTPANKKLFSVDEDSEGWKI